MSLQIPLSRICVDLQIPPIAPDCVTSASIFNVKNIKYIKFGFYFTRN